MASAAGGGAGAAGGAGGGGGSGKAENGGRLPLQSLRLAERLVCGAATEQALRAGPRLAYALGGAAGAEALPLARAVGAP